MSTLIVEVKKIDRILVHPRADKLEIAQLGGWNCVVKKSDQYTAGQLAVFIPPDYIVPKEVSDKFGFTQYTSNGRVRSTRLRGEPSHGVLIKPELAEWKAGTDVAEYYKITKYVPTFNSRKGGARGDQEKPHPLFVKYTEIENLRHYNSVFVEGEEVVVTEKIHGTNSRIAIINGEKMAGSRNHRRKMPMKRKTLPWWKTLWYSVTEQFGKPFPVEPDRERMKEDWYWSPFCDYHVADSLAHTASGHNATIFFGETFGSNVQKGVDYGSKDKLDYRIFDIYVDGKYLDYDQMMSKTEWAGASTVPLIYRGPYSLDKIKELSEGKTTINGATHIREGVVVKPIKERFDPKVGRVILKYVSDSYLLAKETGDFSDDHDVEE